MDVILTSFGIGMEAGPVEYERDPRFSLFYRMPPLMLEEKGTFRLDYASLFLFDRVIIDGETFERAVDPKLEEYYSNGLNQSSIKMLGQSLDEYSKLFLALKSSGRLITKDFNEIFSRFKQVWSLATDYDMENITKWIEPLKLSLNKWDEVQKIFIGGVENFWASFEIDPGNLLFMPYRPHALTVYDHAEYCLETLENWGKEKDRESRDEARKMLREYLAYINFNLILSFQYGAAFLDWEDMQPFYDKKFKSAIYRKPHGIDAVKQSRKLFEMIFPHFVPENPKKLVKALEDKRIDELRRLIHQSLEGSVDFDSDFAIRTLKEVLRLEHKAIVKRRISGWATLPLGFIPVVGNVVQKAVDELLISFWANKELKNYKWYYLINEVDASS